MAPSTSHGRQSSPPSDSIQPKRSLRSRGSNAGIIEPREDTNDGKESGKGSLIGGGGGDLGDARGVGYAAVGGDLPLPLDLKTTSSMSLTQFLSGFVVPLVNGEHRKRKRSLSAGEQHTRDKKVSVSRTKETPEQVQFREFVSQVYTILESRDSNPSVLHFTLPLPQIEETTNVKRSKTDPLNEDKSLSSKLINNEYTSVSQIEDDLLVATQGILVTLPINTQPYKAVTNFYTLAQTILLNHPSTNTKPGQHTLRSSSSSAVAVTNGTKEMSPTVPTVRPPLREALYTMGPNGPLFTSIALRETSPLIAQKLPTNLTLPTSTGGTFTASATSIVPTNVASVLAKQTPDAIIIQGTEVPETSAHGAEVRRRTLGETVRERRKFDRKRGDFSDDRLGKVQSTRWLDWGCHASFAPEWDDGGVGGSYGAEVVALDWAYKKLRRERQFQKLKAEEEAREEGMENGMDKMNGIEETIDETLVLQWEGSEVPKDLKTEPNEEDDQQETEEKEIGVDEILGELRGMIGLLAQMQTLRLAQGKAEAPEDEFALATNIITTIQSLILTHSIPPSALQSCLPPSAYNILQLTHPSYIGSLPPKSLPQWQPPNPLPQAPPPHQNRGINTYQQPPRQLHPPPPQQQPRLQPGTPGMQGMQGMQGTPGAPGYQRPLPQAPMGRYPLTPQTPGYGTPAGGYNILNSANRSVGRPRKHGY